MESGINRTSKGIVTKIARVAPEVGRPLDVKDRPLLVVAHDVSFAQRDQFLTQQEAIAIESRM